MPRLNFNPEEVAEESLKILLAEKTISHYLHARKNGQLDNDGADFFVYMWNGLCLPLQITGDPNCVKDHKKKHPHILHILVVNRIRPHFYAKKIRRLIQRYDSALNLLPEFG